MKVKITDFLIVVILILVAFSGYWTGDVDQQIARLNELTQLQNELFSTNHHAARNPKSR
jgi:hypothetical protein